MQTDWLDRRIAEVVGGVTDQQVPVKAGERVVVCMKLRMEEREWAFLKKQFHSWIPRGIEARFTARYEKEFPNWYQTFTTEMTSQAGLNSKPRQAPMRT